MQLQAIKIFEREKDMHAPLLKKAPVRLIDNIILFISFNTLLVKTARQ